MSWDVYLSCEHCGNSFSDESCRYEWNYTFNVHAMLVDAGFVVRDMDKMRAGEVVPKLESAIKRLESDPEKYRSMNPKNGWGDYDRMLDNWLRPMLVAFKEKPGLIVNVF